MKCVVNGMDRLFSEDDNVSVNSKPDHHPGRPSRIRTFSLPGGVWILNQRHFLQFSKTSGGTSRFVSKKLGQLEKQVFLCCFMSTFAKTVMSTVSLITQTTISAISVILTKFSGHPRVIFANARSSLKF